MKVKELVKVLKKLPQDKEVSIFYDGAARGEVEGIVDDSEVVIVAEWSVYRKKFPEVVYARGETQEQRTIWQRWLLTLFREKCPK